MFGVEVVRAEVGEELVRRFEEGRGDLGRAERVERAAEAGDREEERGRAARREGLVREEGEVAGLRLELTQCEPEERKRGLAFAAG